jgi:hypothetical protein
MLLVNLTQVESGIAALLQVHLTRPPLVSQISSRAAVFIIIL